LRALRPGMFVPSIERFVRMVDENGHVALTDDGIWQKRADGSPLQFTDSMGRKFSPPLLRADFEAWRTARLISQDMSASTKQRLVFALTRGGVEAVTKIAADAGLGKLLLGDRRDLTPAARHRQDSVGRS